MIGQIIGTGRGISGLVAYLTHDSPTEQVKRPETVGRIAWVHTANSCTDDVHLAVRVMQGLTADASILKARSGGSGRGKKLKDPYVHLVFSWPAGEHPTIDEQIEAVEGGLAELGLADRMSVWVAHNDSAHFHIHVAASRISLQDGRAAGLNNAKLRLSSYSSRFEAEHGGIRIPNRVARQKARERFSAEAAFQPDPEHTKRKQQKERARARRQVIARLRASGRHTMPPMEAKRARADRHEPASRRTSGPSSMRGKRPAERQSPRAFNSD